MVYRSYIFLNLFGMVVFGFDFFVENGDLNKIFIEIKMWNSVDC